MTYHTTSKLKLNVMLIAGFCAMTAAANVHAAGTINSLVTTPGTTYETTGLQINSDLGVPVLGTDMNAGLQVNVQFLNGMIESVNWDPSTGSASGTGWQLATTGDTLVTPWILRQVGSFPTGAPGIDSMQLEFLSGSANAVWDTGLGGNTPNSNAGTTFALAGSQLGSWDVDVTYRDEIALQGTAAQGDIFRELRIDFVGNSSIGVFDIGDQMAFVADTDLLMAGAVLSEQSVPEPTGIVLAISAVAACGWNFRQRKRKV